jgi:hypothetical protein
MKLTKIEILVSSDDNYDILTEVMESVQEYENGVRVLDYRESDVTTEGWN